SIKPDPQRKEPHETATKVSLRRSAVTLSSCKLEGNCRAMDQLNHILHLRELVLLAGCPFRRHGMGLGDQSTWRAWDIAEHAFCQPVSSASCWFHECDSCCRRSNPRNGADCRWARVCLGHK